MIEPAHLSLLTLARNVKSLYLCRCSVVLTRRPHNCGGRLPSCILEAPARGVRCSPLARLPTWIPCSALDVRSWTNTLAYSPPPPTIFALSWWKPHKNVLAWHLTCRHHMSRINKNHASQSRTPWYASQCRGYPMCNASQPPSAGYAETSAYPTMKTAR